MLHLEGLFKKRKIKITNERRELTAFRLQRMWARSRLRAELATRVETTRVRIEAERDWGSRKLQRLCRRRKDAKELVSRFMVRKIILEQVVHLGNLPRGRDSSDLCRHVGRAACRLTVINVSPPLLYAHLYFSWTRIRASLIANTPCATFDDILVFGGRRRPICYFPASKERLKTCVWYTSKSIERVCFASYFFTDVVAAIMWLRTGAVSAWSLVLQPRHRASPRHLFSPVILSRVISLSRSRFLQNLPLAVCQHCTAKIEVSPLVNVPIHKCIDIHLLTVVASPSPRARSPFLFFSALLSHRFAVYYDLLPRTPCPCRCRCPAGKVAARNDGSRQQDSGVVPPPARGLLRHPSHRGAIPASIQGTSTPQVSFVTHREHRHASFHCTLRRSLTLVLFSPWSSEFGLGFSTEPSWCQRTINYEART